MTLLTPCAPASRLWPLSGCIDQQGRGEGHCYWLSLVECRRESKEKEDELGKFHVFLSLTVSYPTMNLRSDLEIFRDI